MPPEDEPDDETEAKKKAAAALKARVRGEWRTEGDELGALLHQLCDLHDEPTEEPPAPQHLRAVERLKKVRSRARLGASAPGANEAERAMIERRLKRWRRDASALQKLVRKRFGVGWDEL